MKFDDFIFGMILFTALYVGIGSLIVILTGCGTEEKTDKRSTPYVVETEKEVNVEVEKEVTVEVEKVSPPSLAGYKLLPDGGYLELFETYDGRIYVFSTQLVFTRNLDGGLAKHPSFLAGPHVVKDGVVTIQQNINYNATVNDVEKDGTCSNISGTRFTILTMRMVDNKFTLNIKIYSADGLSIDVDRTLTEEV